MDHNGWGKAMVSPALKSVSYKVTVRSMHQCVNSEKIHSYRYKILSYYGVYHDFWSELAEVRLLRPQTILKSFLNR